MRAANTVEVETPVAPATVSVAFDGTTTQPSAPLPERCASVWSAVKLMCPEAAMSTEAAGLTPTGADAVPNVRSAFHALSSPAKENGPVFAPLLKTNDPPPRTSSVPEPVMSP